MRGMVLAKPGTIKPHRKFKAVVYVLKKEEGGRHTPIFDKYRPQFFLGTSDVTGIITLHDKQPMIMPGDYDDIEVELIADVALFIGLRFLIREGGRIVSFGFVTEIIE